MALHTKWTSGDLTFYDGTQDVFKIQDNDEGVIFGESDEGIDVKFWGETTGAYILWEATTGDTLKFAGGAGLELDGGDLTLKDNDYLYFGDEPDISMRWSTANTAFEVIPDAENSEVYLGSTDAPLKVKFFGTTGTTNNMQWSSTGSELLLETASLRVDAGNIALEDNDYLYFGGTGGTADISMRWSTGSTGFVVIPDAANAEVYLGSTDEPLRVKFFGTTGTTDNVQWDSSGSELLFEAAGIRVDGANIALEDDDYIYLGGTGGTADISMRWDVTASGFDIIPTAANTEVFLGSTDVPLKVKFFGTTGTTNNMQWDSTGNVLDFTGADIALNDADFIKFGDTGNISVNWTAGDALEVLPTVKYTDVELGSTATPLDVKFFTTGAAYMQWVSSGMILDIDGADIELGDNDYIKFGDTGELSIRWTTGVLEVLPKVKYTDVELGSTSVPLDVKFFTTGASYMQWSASGMVLDLDGADIELGDGDEVKFGDTGELSMQWTTGKLEVIPTVANVDIELGSTDKPLDVKFFGTTGTTNNMQWDSSGSELTLSSVDLTVDGGDITLGDDDYIKFGDTGELTMRWTAANVFEVIPATSGSGMNIGSASKPLNVTNYGDITYRVPQEQTSATGENKELGSTSNRIQFLSSTASNFNLIVPESSGTGVAGIKFDLFNSTGGTCTVCEGSTSTVIIAIGVNESAIVASNATEWRYILGTS